MGGKQWLFSNLSHPVPCSGAEGCYSTNRRFCCCCRCLFSWLVGLKKKNHCSSCDVCLKTFILVDGFLLTIWYDIMHFIETYGNRELESKHGHLTDLVPC